MSAPMQSEAELLLPEAELLLPWFMLFALVGPVFQLGNEGLLTLRKSLFLRMM